MGTSKYRAPDPRRQKMVSIVVAGVVPLALVLGGTAIANVGATSATVTRSGDLQSGYALPEPPPPHVPSPEEPLLERPHPERPNPEQNQPEQPPGQTLPDQPAR